MIKELMHDLMILVGKLKGATKEDLLNTLTVHKDSCVGVVRMCLVYARALLRLITKVHI